MAMDIKKGTVLKKSPGTGCLFPKILFFLLCAAAALLIAGSACLCAADGSLESEKLRIEIQNMKNEQKIVWIKFVLTNLLAAGGIITAIWTVYSGLKTLKKNQEDKLNIKVSELLKSVVAESEYERLGSARSLGKYSNHSIEEIISIAANEKSEIVKNVLESILCNIKKESIPQLVQCNSNTISDRAMLAGRMKRLGVDGERAAALLRLMPEVLSGICGNKTPLRISYEYGEKSQNALLERAGILKKEEDELPALISGFKEALYKDSEVLSRYAEISGRVIAYWLKTNMRFKCPETGIDLSETNMYKAYLSHFNINNGFFNYCLMRHSKLDRSSFHYSFFCCSDMYDSTLNNGKFCYSNLKGIHLRKCTAKSIQLHNTVIDEAVFSESNLKNAAMNNTEGKAVKFRKVNLTNARFMNCSLLQGEFQTSSFMKSSITDCKFYRANFVSVGFRGSKIFRTFFNGADLRGADFKNAVLEDVDFSGAKIANADFKGAVLKNVVFEKCSGIESAVFDQPDMLLYNANQPSAKL